MEVSRRAALPPATLSWPRECSQKGPLVPVGLNAELLSFPWKRQASLPELLPMGKWLLAGLAVGFCFQWPMGLGAFFAFGRSDQRVRESYAFFETDSQQPTEAGPAYGHQAPSYPPWNLLPGVLTTPQTFKVRCYPQYWSFTHLLTGSPMGFRAPPHPPPSYPFVVAGGTPAPSSCPGGFHQF